MRRTRVFVRATTDPHRSLQKRVSRAAREIEAELAVSAHAIRSSAQTHLDDATRRPISRTGTLAASLYVVQRAGQLVAHVGTALAYGAYLEFGTRRMPAYPWLRPAVMLHRAGLRDRVRRIVTRVFQERD